MSAATFSTHDIADAVGMSVRAIQIRAVREKWACVITPGRGRGGEIRKYIFDQLPTEVRLAVQIRQHQHSGAIAPKTQTLPELCDKKPTALCQPQEKKALAKADLLRLYLGAIEKAAWGQKKDARNAFMDAYNTGIPYPTLFKALGPVNWKTVEGWKRTINQKKDVNALADRRGYYRRGLRGVGNEQGKVLLRLALNPNRPKLSAVIRLARTVMAQMDLAEGYSNDTYRRWLKEWKSSHYDVWVFYREGYKAWNDKVAYYLERNYDLIGVGDVLVADGHTLNFETINPFTGKAKRMTLILWYDMKSNYPLGWEVMPTENTQAIAAAFRRAVIRLGKYPRVAYLDNGRAFRARFFQGCTNFEEAGFAGIYANMGVATCFAWPYHGQSKTVERFFGTMAELERWLPTYSGTSIQAKPPRMMRGEKLHRKVHEKLYSGRCLTMEETHTVIAAWFDDYAQRPQGKGSHIAGKCPMDLFVEGIGPGVNREELRQLMMSEDVRKVYRNGIRFPGVGHFFNDELSHIRHPVRIRYDLQDLSEIYVYDLDNHFICTAKPVDKVHPMASYLGTEADREQVAEQIALKKRQEKLVSTSARQFLNDEMLPEHRRLLQDMGIGTLPTLPADLPIEQADPPKPLPATEKKRLERVLKAARKAADIDASAPKMAARPDIFMNDREHYDWAFRSVYQHKLAIPEDDHSWMAWFETTEVFKEKYRNHYADLRQIYGEHSPQRVAINA